MGHARVDLTKLADRKTVDYPDGRVVFIKGDRGDAAYVVKSGRIAIRESGRVVETMEPGELFGEMALIDAEPRSASAVAVGPVKLIVIDHASFHALVRNDPDFALDVMRFMSRRLRAKLAAERPAEVMPVAPRFFA